MRDIIFLYKILGGILSTNKVSLIINGEEGFEFNFEDLIFLGISNFQSQVGAITRETGGRLQGGRGTLGEGEEGTKMIIFIYRIRFRGQTSEWAPTVGYHGVVKCLIGSPVLKPISNCLLVCHSF